MNIKLSLLTLVTVLLCTSVFSQNNPKSQRQETNKSTEIVPIDKTTNKIQYREVVKVQGTQEELFNRAIEWINTEYKNPVAVTRVRNPHTGIIDIIHRIEVKKEVDKFEKTVGVIDYFLKLELKENRYRYTINDFILRGVSRYPIENWLDTSARDYSPDMADYLKQVDEFCKGLISRLKEGMQPQVVPVEEEW